VPLPLISASPPSAFCNVIVQSAPVLGRRTDRDEPVRADPSCRSHSRAAVSSRADACRRRARAERGSRSRWRAILAKCSKVMRGRPRRSRRSPPECQDNGREVVGISRRADQSIRGRAGTRLAGACELTGTAHASSNASAGDAFAGEMVPGATPGSDGRHGRNPNDLAALSWHSGRDAAIVAADRA